MKSAATKAEESLVREKAAGMTLLELREEIARCQRGIQVAANSAAVTRFERRLKIMQDALSILERKAAA